MSELFVKAPLVYAFTCVRSAPLANLVAFCARPEGKYRNGGMTISNAGSRWAFPKEVLIGRIESGRRLAQVVVKMKDEVGAMASVSTLAASLGVDTRQSSTHSLDDGTAIYNAFVVLKNSDVSLVRLVDRLEKSPFVLQAQAFEGHDGVVVDQVSFPVNWQGRRVIVLSQPATAKMFEAIRSILGTGGEVVLYQQGLRYGRDFAEHFVSKVGRDYLARNYDYGLAVLAATGWGIPELNGSKDDFPNITVKLTSCLECDGIRHDWVVCSFMRGFLSGLFGTIAGHNVHCEETQCKAKGHSHCQFVLHSGKSVLTR